jgi:hypothetical protein
MTFLEQQAYREKLSANRVELAKRLYVQQLSRENLTMWPGNALDALAMECVRAAMHFNIAEAQIWDIYCGEKEAKDGKASPG